MLRTTHAVDDASERTIGRIALPVVVLLHVVLLLAVRTQLQPRPAAPVEPLQVILLTEHAAPVPPPPPWPQPPPHPRHMQVQRASAPLRAQTPSSSPVAVAPPTTPVDTLQSAEDFAPFATTPSWTQPGIGTDPLARRSPSEQLPGRAEAYVRIEGMRDPVSPADAVRMVGRLLFGAGEGDSCAKREERLLNETDPIVREIDVRKWRRLCRG